MASADCVAVPYCGIKENMATPGIMTRALDIRHDAGRYDHLQEWLFVSQLNEDCQRAAPDGCRQSISSSPHAFLEPHTAASACRAVLITSEVNAE